MYLVFGMYCLHRQSLDAFAENAPVQRIFLIIPCVYQGHNGTNW